MRIMEELPAADLRGRLAIVTGAARGLGRRHVELLAARGAVVADDDLGQPAWWPMLKRGPGPLILASSAASYRHPFVALYAAVERGIATAASAVAREAAGLGGDVGSITRRRRQTIEEVPTGPGVRPAARLTGEPGR